MAKQYNLIYEQLVKNENDILGIVAYSVYKRQKIELIKAKSNDGKKEISDSELQSFTELSTSKAQLAFYEEAAAGLLDEYATISESEKIKELEENYNSQLEQNKKDYERRLRSAKSTNFFYGVAQSIVASFLVVLLIGFIAFTFWGAKQGFTPIIEEIFQVQILPKANGGG